MKERVFAGFKDKTNKDVYTGDLVYLESWNDHMDSLPLDEIRYVVLKDNEFCVQEINGEAHCSVDFINSDYCEIIGTKRDYE